MSRNSVQIDRLDLRIPGISRDQAQRLGADVAQHIARSLPLKGNPQRLGAIEMQVSVRPGTPRNQMARLIAESIVEKLR